MKETKHSSLQIATKMELSRLSMIVRVILVGNKTVADMRTVNDVSTTCEVAIFKVKVSCITLVDGIKQWLWI